MTSPTQLNRSLHVAVSPHPRSPRWPSKEPPLDPPCRSRGQLTKILPLQTPVLSLAWRADSARCDLCPTADAEGASLSRGRSRAPDALRRGSRLARSRPTRIPGTSRRSRFWALSITAEEDSPRRPCPSPRHRLPRLQLPPLQAPVRPYFFGARSAQAPLQSPSRARAAWDVGVVVVWVRAFRKS